MAGDLHRSARNATRAPALPATAGATNQRPAAHRAQAGLLQAERGAADFYTAGTTPEGEPDAEAKSADPGSFTHRALLAQARWGHVLAYSIACDLLVNGTTWAEVAAVLGMSENLVRGRYEEFVDQLAVGAEHPSWLPRIGNVTVTAPGEVVAPATQTPLEAHAPATPPALGD